MKFTSSEMFVVPYVPLRNDRCTIYTYYKQLKLCGRNVSQFIGFYHNEGKTYSLLLLTRKKLFVCIVVLIIKLVGKILWFVENPLKLQNFSAM